jgi:predicted house-cleaning noncanonical NTP pyrophosphatase (MazG superfamily)
VEQWEEEKRKETTLFKKNNFIKDSEGNEENRYPVPYSNKTKINNTKEPSDAHKNNLKEEILQVITENFMEKILDILTKMYKMHLRNFNTPKIENTRRQRNK